MNFKKKLRRLNEMSDSDLDDRFEVAHEKAFKKIDCLTCANCCKTKGPAFSKKDISRIARHQGITPSEFADEHLEFNEDDNYVLKNTPCLFLQGDNKCEIYEIRPGACASYPHTNTRNVSHLFPYFETHLATCPIIEEVIKGVQE